MYCVGVIKPSKKPCGFVIPVFVKNLDDQEYYLSNNAPNGTILSFSQCDNSYPIELSELEIDNDFSKYEETDPAPIAFIYYLQDEPKMFLGQKEHICRILATLVTSADVKMPIEAKYKAAQSLGSRYLPPDQVLAIYEEYFAHLCEMDMDYAEMWRQNVLRKEQISIGQNNQKQKSMTNVQDEFSKTRETTEFEIGRSGLIAAKVVAMTGRKDYGRKRITVVSLKASFPNEDDFFPKSVLIDSVRRNKEKIAQGKGNVTPPVYRNLHMSSEMLYYKPAAHKEMHRNNVKKQVGRSNWRSITQCRLRANIAECTPAVERKAAEDSRIRKRNWTVGNKSKYFAELDITGTLSSLNSREKETIYVLE